MSDKNTHFAQIAASGDVKFERVQAQITAQAERKLKSILARWHKRFPDRSFRAAQCHGLLTIQASPPFGEETRPEHHRRQWRDIGDTPRECQIGKVGLLVRDVSEVETSWAQLEWRLSTFESDGWMTVGQIAERA